MLNGHKMVHKRTRTQERKCLMPKGFCGGPTGRPPCCWNKTCTLLWRTGKMSLSVKCCQISNCDSPPGVRLLSLTCCLLRLCSAEDIQCIVHGIELHGVHRVGRQGVDWAHHDVATEVGEDGSFRGVLGRCCDLVGAGTGVVAPLHRHALRCDREHWQRDVWRR